MCIDSHLNIQITQTFEKCFILAPTGISFFGSCSSVKVTEIKSKTPENPLKINYTKGVSFHVTRSAEKVSPEIPGGGSYSCDLGYPLTPHKKPRNSEFPAQYSDQTKLLPGDFFFSLFYPSVHSFHISCLAETPSPDTHVTVRSTGTKA